MGSCQNYGQPCGAAVFDFRAEREEKKHEYVGIQAENGAENVYVSWCTT
jgi:hypothetical protein